MNQQPQHLPRTFARVVRSLAIAKGDPVGALAYAEAQNWHDAPEATTVLRAIVAPVSMSAALAPVTVDLDKWLQPRTILGRLRGISRRVPLNTNLVGYLGGAVAGWRGEGKPLPATAVPLTTASALWPTTVGCIAAMSNDVVRMSPGLADPLIVSAVGGALALAMDVALIDADNAGETEARPESITHAGTQLVSSGSTAVAVEKDLRALVATVSAVHSLATAAWITSHRTAVYLAGLRDSGGGLLFPGITARGGELWGLPVITSVAAASGGSPSEGTISLLEADQLLSGDMGLSSVDYSENAALQLNDAPSDGAQQLTSLWQRGLLGIKVQRAVNWGLTSSAACATLRGVNY